MGDLSDLITSKTQQPASGLDNAWRRIVVGIGEIPAILPGLLTIPKAAGDLANYGLYKSGALKWLNDHGLNHGPNSPDDTSDATGQALGKASDFVSKKIDDYENFLRRNMNVKEGNPDFSDSMLELGGSMFGNPLNLFIKGLERIAPAAAKAVTPAARLALASPETIAGKAGMTGVSAGLDMTGRKLVTGEWTGNPGEEPAQPATANAPQQDDFITQLNTLSKPPVADAAANAPQQDDFIASLNELSKPPAKKTGWFDELIDEGEKHSAAVTAGLAVAGVLGLMLTRGKSSQALLRDLETPGVKNLAGLNEATNVLPTTARVKAGFVDPMYAVKPIIAKIRGGKVPDLVEDTMTLSSPAAIGERTAAAFRNGKIVDSEAVIGTKDVPSLAHAAETTAKLAPEDQALFKDSAMYRNELANVEAGIPARTDMSVEDMKALVAKGEAHPVVGKLLDFTKAFTNGFADLFLEKGIIDHERHATYLSRPFLPEISADRKTLNTQLQSFLSGNVSDDPVTDFTHLFKREGTTAQTLPPIEALEQYGSAALKFVEQNTIRRKIIGTVRGSAERGMRDYQGVITKVDGPARRDGITIRNNGDSEHYRVHEPALLTALRFYPEQVGPIANALRRGLQFMTTGRGAPWFAPISMIYDAMGAAVLHPRGTNFGLFRGDVIGGTALSAGHALGAMGAQLARAAGQGLTASLAAEGTLVRIFGKPAVSRAATAMSRAYARSTLALMESWGAGGGTLASVDAEIRNGYSVLKKIAPGYASKYPGARRLLNAYDGMLESIQNGARLAMISRNMKEGMSKTQMFRLMAGTRQLTGDFSVSGASKIAKTMQSVFPYYNVTVQSQAQWARMFKAQPFHTMMGIVTGFAIPTAISVYYASTLGPEYADFYWKKMSTSQRDGFWYAPVPWLPPEKGIMIPMLPEWRPFAAAMRAGMDALFGLSSGKINDELHAGMRKGIDDFMGARDLQDITQAAMGGLSPIGALPPGINALLGIGGASIDPAQMRIYEPAPLRASPLDPTSGTIQNDVMSKAMSNAIIALSGTAGQFMIDTYRAATLKYRDDGSFFDAIDAGAQQLGLDVGSKVPVVNTTLLGQQIRQSRSTVDSKVYHDKTNAIQRIVAGFGNDVAHPTVIGTGARAVKREGEYPTGIADQRMIKVFALVHGVAPALSQLSYNVSRLGSQITDVNSNQRSSPQEKLDAVNALNKQMVEAQGKMLDYIRRFVEDPLKNMVLDGQHHRDIDITKLERSSHVEDFPVIH